jgi:predicted NBD/HSP70 family sugar kinase
MKGDPIMDCYAGLDISLEETSVCIVDTDGKIVREAKVPTDPDALAKDLASAKVPLKRVGLAGYRDMISISVTVT